MTEGLPQGVADVNQWYTLVARWFTEKSKKMSEVNCDNTKKKKLHHTAGRRSIARIRKELREKLGRALTRLEVFEVLHKRNDGTYINDYAKDFMDKAAEMEGPREEVFQKLAGPELNGRLRWLGLGPTPTTYFGVCSRGAACGSCSAGHSCADATALKEELREVKKHMDIMARFISRQFPGQNYMEDAENNQGATSEAAPSMGSRAS
ncbi:unnamed protein product [Linum trigynum]|uniref:Uncharacterized protein n=1 Tax=Linum trigynum TaxID=586398 RepID=A0AAV2E5J2_9ROSI